MNEGEDFRRRWRVSFLRLGIVLVVIVAAAWTFYASTTGEMERMRDPHAFSFAQSLAIVAVAPLLWLIPFGATADHYLSHRGPRAVLVVHLVGVHVAAFIVAPLYLLNSAPLGEPYATLRFGSIALWTVTGFAAAGLVPGSFPRGSWRLRLPRGREQRQHVVLEQGGEVVGQGL